MIDLRRKFMAAQSGEEWSDYYCEYGYQGARWGFTVKATSWDDARARVKAMGLGQVLGSNVQVIYVPVGLGWLARLHAWFTGRMV